MSRPILEVSGLSMRFGGLLAVNGVALSVQEKQVVSMIGPVLICEARIRAYSVSHHFFESGPGGTATPRPRRNSRWPASSCSSPTP